jgi:hypothetical protein
VNEKTAYVKNNEITVPAGNDPVGSYFMGNGFGEGYFGIQVNSAIERKVLFSVWSPFETDDPREIPDDKKIILLKKGKEVHAGEFGSEGSGGQSYLKYNWKAFDTGIIVLFSSIAPTAMFRALLGSSAAAKCETHD